MKLIDKIFTGIIITAILFLALDALIVACNYLYDKDIIWLPLLISFLVGYTYVLKKK